MAQQESCLASMKRACSDYKDMFEFSEFKTYDYSHKLHIDELQIWLRMRACRFALQFACLYIGITTCPLWRMLKCEGYNGMVPHTASGYQCMFPMLADGGNAVPKYERALVLWCKDRNIKIANADGYRTGPIKEHQLYTLYFVVKV